MGRFARGLSQATSGHLARRSGVSARVRRKASLLTSAGIVVVLLVVSSAIISIKRYDDEVFVLEESVELDAPLRGHRRLSDDSSLYPEDLILGKKPYEDSPRRYLVFIHVILIGYMLLGLNTVCDVYFTGALDVMVEKWNIKPDVAGATFMAAGGSAPELFTSLVGACVAKNDVGFGTIVGSAVFNVLFVIGLCGFAAKEPIKLTWWPLFRDCTFYIIGLSMLALCASDQQIEWWEALMLFIGYLFYIAFMYNNEKFELYTDTEYWAASRKRDSFKQLSMESLGASSTSVVPDGNGTQEPREPKRISGTSRADQVMPAPEPPDEESPGASERQASESSELRSGAGSGCETPPARTVSKASTMSVRRLSRIHGKMHAMVFVGHCALQRHEARMAQVTAPLEALAVCEERQSLEIPAIDIAAPGRVSSKSLDDIPPLPIPVQEEPPLVKAEDGDAETPGETPGEEKEVCEEETEGHGDLMTMPEGFTERLLWYVSLPVYVPLYYLIPEPSEKWFLLTFAISLFWIASFSFLMVWWFEILGQMLNIPTLIMGLTVIAAGTSIPDAASSLAVARMGEGDMAVSSSIGSNIFDILVGLPVPWMVKIGIIEMGDFKIALQSEYLTFYVLLLMCMVLMVVISIHLLGWVLNKTLGCCMGFLYAVFLILVLTVEGMKPSWLMF